MDQEQTTHHGEDISMTNIERFIQMVKESDHIVFFGGAGVSTESGIPDFRSVDGLYHQKYDFKPFLLYK